MAETNDSTQETQRTQKTHTTQATYITTLNKQTSRIQVSRQEDASITVDGNEYGIDWRQIAPLSADSKGIPGEGGRYSLLIGGHSYEVFARRITRADQKGSETYEITVGEQRFEVTVEDERVKLLIGMAKSTATVNEAVVQAPMPGLVIGVPLEPGMQVEVGQTVIVLEAMKMENDLPAPIAGIIKDIRVTKGQTVDQGAALVVIKAEE